MTVNLSDFFSGDLLPLEIVFKDDNGQYVDATDFSFWITFKTDKDLDDSDATLQLRFYNNGTTVDSTQGKVILNLIPAMTRQLTPGRYYWDIQIVNESDDTVRTIGSGSLRVKRDITRNS